jgi:hypothetical protein
MELMECACSYACGHADGNFFFAWHADGNVPFLPPKLLNLLDDS